MEKELKNSSNENQQMSHKKINILKFLILGLVSIIIFILAFGLGVFVGEKKAKFSYRWAEEYHRMFGGPKGGFLKDCPVYFQKDEFIKAHGSLGEIIKIGENEIIIKDKENVEKVILITEKTAILKRRAKIKKEELKEGDFVVIIGSPTKEGKIEAKIIRVFDKTIEAQKNFRVPLF